MKDVKEEKPAETVEPAAGTQVPAPAKAAKPPKSEQTRTLILETALRLFRERGYDKTTMRAIAQEAGVSVGNAYYYFSSKEHLVQGFYDRIAEEHQAAVAEILDSDEKDLTARIRGVLLGWLDIAEPYHEFAAQFFKNAADPDSPLSPFSPESEGPREAAIEVHRRVISGASVKIDPELAEPLPQLLWLQQMGLVLFWVYDRSEGAANSRRLVERLAPVTARAISLSRFRLLRPLVRETHDLLADFMPTAAGMAASGRPQRGPSKAAKKTSAKKTAKPAEKAPDEAPDKTRGTNGGEDGVA